MKLLYEGKAKRIYETQNPNEVICEFKDSLTAFNGEKADEESGKGALNCAITTLIFEALEKEGIPTHLIKQIDETKQLVKKVDIILIEVVVRNIVAGSLAKRLGLKEGTKLPFTIVEFYYKNDDLNDPLINDDHAMVLELVKTRKELDLLREYGLKVNKFLSEFFDKVGLTLVDFKIEFGRDENGNIILADEITPDSCRLWDKKTGKKLDKDLFRFNLGNIKEAYTEVLNRLKDVK
ncbi:phosphoribosylaminoimidazole-succinocarboxamide synthase [Nautilia profundicola AmH]|uniref:Phosphoribosylaminoimidazole-succinocarboxamide synthase n=1 Tax=Nautilia profundicola (strain ATCC BAA-1463 / DSM 18972 / AmH) TaxID=598659 RepID=PUR7_NAUPA|nr:phosphoribosylaminoimidazolesuccinocarboxamide synthase [Nautilia profundicola]B9L8V5.1 RecName: Full=Phosphoribosylaminoimidazole-succinocarboxamide synthase; AltName: Full=SAICAR synthetase [Nautilia profundicola AmH]ACM92547.1 phosphoribosylaminoimidazole-succinocarboxamide synthase [Nautilia profundicola AmH]